VLRAIIILPAVLFLSLIGWQADAQVTAEQNWVRNGATPLTAKQLRDLYTGKKVSWVGNKFAGTTSYNSNGRASITWSDKSTIGNWFILDGKLCTKWVSFRPKRTTCSRVYDNRDGTYEVFIAQNGVRLRTDKFNLSADPVEDAGGGQENEPEKSEVPSETGPVFTTPGTGTGFKSPGGETGFKTPGTGTGSLFKPAK
jgi:Protein of unknown function (DUF995)